MHDRVIAAPIEDVQRRSFPDSVAVPNAQSIRPIECHVDEQPRIIRIHSSRSQTEFGRMVGSSYQQIQKYKSGKNLMSASFLYKVANCLNFPIARFFVALPQVGSAWSDGCLPEIGERIAYLGSSGGRRFGEEILRLPPQLRTRTLALIKLAARDDDDDDATKPRDVADAETID